MGLFCRLPEWDGTEGNDTKPVKCSTHKEVEKFYDDQREKHKGKKEKDGKS